MDPHEFIELADRLESAYKAQDSLKEHTETLAKGARDFVRTALTEYFETKEMLLAIANRLKIRAVHYVYSDEGPNAHPNYVHIGMACGVLLEFIHNGDVDDSGDSGSGYRYGRANERTKYTDCRLTWSLSQSPDIQFDLTYANWVEHGKSPEETLRHFDTHRWSAEGYVQLKKKAVLLNKRTKLMKECFAEYSEGIMKKARDDTADLVC